MAKFQGVLGLHVLTGVVGKCANGLQGGFFGPTSPRNCLAGGGVEVFAQEWMSGSCCNGRTWLTIEISLKPTFLAKIGTEFESFGLLLRFGIEFKL